MSRSPMLKKKKEREREHKKQKAKLQNFSIAKHPYSPCKVDLTRSDLDFPN